MIGPWQIVIILLIVMVLFGGRKLPELGKGLGEAIRGFKKGLDGDEVDVTNSTKRESIKSGEDEGQAARKSKDRSEDRNDA